MINKSALNIGFLGLCFYLIGVTAHSEATAPVKASSSLLRKQYRNQLELAKKSKDPNKLWYAYFNFAWFEQETSNHKKALQYSNSALTIAKKLNDPFRLARTYSWIGWSHSNMGRYTLALLFYQKALDLAAPQGRIKNVMTWGLSTQEMGAIYMRLGRLKKAEEKLLETFNYAKANKINIGVAEGGAHLADLYLLKGNYSKAQSYAQSAIAAAESGQCSRVSLARAQVKYAKVVWHKVIHHPHLHGEARKLAAQALKEAEKVASSRYVAEAKLLLSQLTPWSEIETKLKLAKEAMTSLQEKQSELRGLAEAQFGTALMADDQKELAKFYLKNGLKVSSKMFREVDVAYIQTDLAYIENLKPKQKATLIKFEQIGKRALKMGVKPLAMDNYYHLAVQYFELGYFEKTLQVGGQALELIDEMLMKDEDIDHKVDLKKLRIDLIYKLTQSELRLNASDRPDTF